MEGACMKVEEVSPSCRGAENFGILKLTRSQAVAKIADHTASQQTI